jgi:hypothetical protein
VRFTHYKKACETRPAPFSEKPKLINGRLRRPYHPGEKGEEKVMRRKTTLLLLAVFFSVALSGFATADTYYVYTQWGGTWHDANKTGTGDSNLCWAAAASNILDWAGWGTASLNNQTSIFNYFTAHWTDVGSLPEYAWDWWLNGTSPPAQSGWSQVDVTGGGFWSGVNFDNYFHLATGGNLLAAVDSFFDSGYGVTLGIYRRISGTTYGHALTCWGYDFTTDGTSILYKGVWVTDSDDGAEALRYYALILLGGVYYLDDYFSTDSWYIGVVEALGQNPVPLPPTLLLFGSGLLGLVGWRRYRKE